MERRNTGKKIARLSDHFVQINGTKTKARFAYLRYAMESTKD